MKSILRNNPLARLLELVQRRFNRTRAGSVLILVVGLLVVLAMMATAMISITRIDRYATQQNTANTQIDMLMDGMIELAKGEIANGAFGDTKPATGVKYRPVSVADTTDVANTYNYQHYDGPNENNHLWLGARTPVLVAPNGGGTKRPGWAAMSMPLIRNTTGRFQFDSPDSNITYNVPNTIDKQNILALIGSSNTKLSSGKIVSTLSLFDAASAAQSSPDYVYGDTLVSSPTGLISAAAGSNPLTVIAGDADGDGVGDSLMYKLPFGQINGVTFYVGIRIVDNNAAINANTAWARDFDFNAGDQAANPQPGTARNDGFFTSNIGLREMLTTFDAPNPSGGGSYISAEMDRLNLWRFHTTTGATLSPIDDFATLPRTDMAYITQGDAFYNQSGRRLASPGKNIDATNAMVDYRALDLGDTSLAYRFCLVNPYSSQSQIETMLAESVYSPIKSPSRPYAPYAFYGWYDRNFNFDNTTIPSLLGQANAFRRSLRSIVVTNNPTSVFSPQRDMTLLTSNRWPSTIVKEATAVDASSGAELMPNYSLPDASGNIPAAPKVSINTATFGELWRGFWNVMCDKPNTTIFKEPDNVDPTANTPTTPVPALPLMPTDSTPPNPANTPITDMYVGMKYLNPDGPLPVDVFPEPAGGYEPPTTPPSTPRADPVNDPVRPPMPNQKKTDFSATDLANYHSLHMFRSPMRHTDVSAASGDPTNAAYEGWRMDSYNMMMLRSAIAAANTEALRGDPAGLPPEHSVQLMAVKYGDPTLTGPTLVAVRTAVYGTKRQPFITEVYCNNDDVTSSANNLRANPRNGVNSKGYVAIELHNPYSQPIDISNWELQTVDRTTAPATVQYPDAQMIVRFKGGTVVPAKGFLVVDNQDPDDGSNTVNAAKYIPAAFLTNSALTLTNQPYSDPEMYKSIGKEVVLVRPTDKHPSKDTVLNRLIGAPVDFFDLSYFRSPASSDSATLKAVANGGAGVADLTATWVRAWHYVRPTDPTLTPSGAWKFVYPGRYDGDQKLVGSNTTQHKRHQQGYMEEIYRVPAGGGSEGFDPWAASPPSPKLSAGRHNEDGTYPGTQGSTLDDYFTIQLAGDDVPGPNPLTNGPGNKFPFGGFSRVGDLLHATYFGGYRMVETSSGRLAELNSVTMDCAFAEDSQADNDPIEQVGRFLPMSATRTFQAGHTAVGYDKYESVLYMGNPYWAKNANTTSIPNKTASTADWILTKDRQAWAMDLFEYFTAINNPHDDHLPNADPVFFNQTHGVKNTTIGGTQPGLQFGHVVGGATTGGLTGSANLSGTDDYYNGLKITMVTGNAAGQSTTIGDYVGVNQSVIFSTPMGIAPAAGDVFKIVGTSETSVGVQGLININTAPWYVLAQLPLLPQGPQGQYLAAKGGFPQNAISLAQAIVYFRDVDDCTDSSATPKRHPHGPFKNLFELNQVSNVAGSGESFMTGWDQIFGGGAAWGDQSPGASIKNDFEHRTLQLSRISNLVTTRSDSYTAYILLEGWRGAGTPAAELVVQRRAAKVFDRTPVTGISSKLPATTDVPSD